MIPEVLFESYFGIKHLSFEKVHYRLPDLYAKRKDCRLFTALCTPFVFFPPSFSNFFIAKKQIAADTSWISEMKQLEEYDTGQQTKNNYLQEQSAGNYQFDQDATDTEKKLFYFDPNTISKQEWQQLGISVKTASIIQNYLRKGGKFKNPEDLERTYGLKQQDFERLLPYIQIADEKEHIQTGDKVATGKKENLVSNLSHN